MKYLRYFALVAALLVPLSYSQAAVRVGIGIGVGPGYVAGPPVCEWGYYPDYPYGCAPYGFYSPTWFVNGIFIGAGPWYHGFGRPVYPVRGFYGRPFYGRGPVGVHRGPVIERGPSFRGGIVDRGRAHGSFSGHGPTSFHGGGSHGRR